MQHFNFTFSFGDILWVKKEKISEKVVKKIIRSLGFFLGLAMFRTIKKIYKCRHFPEMPVLGVLMLAWAILCCLYV